MYEFRVVTERDVLQARLLSRARLAPNGCWEWFKSTRRGYGLFYGGGKYQGAHRVSYEAFTGEIIPEGMVVRHTCDNPRCINPNHLVTGTVADNMADREARGRRDVKGEQIGTSKLTKPEVNLILMNKHLSGVQLAALFGVSTSTISLIRKGKGWRHLSATKVAGENDGR